MTEHTCIAPDCEADVAIKKSSLCLPHYNRFNKYGDFNLQPKSKSCKWCEGPIQKIGAHGPPPLYCSADCRGKASSSRRDREYENAKRRTESAAKRASVVKVCKHCSADFTPAKSLRAVFCSRGCRSKFYRDNPARTCSAEDCVRPVRARGLCNLHYRRDARADGRLKPEPWDDRRRKNHAKRLERLSHPGAEDIDLLTVAERDDWVCGICRKPVDGDLEYPDPMSKTTDHVRPLAKGGFHVWGNVQLAHLVCNVRKGDEFSLEVDEMSA